MGGNPQATAKAKIKSPQRQGISRPAPETSSQLAADANIPGTERLATSMAMMARPPAAAAVIGERPAKAAATGSEIWTKAMMAPRRRMDF